MGIKENILKYTEGLNQTPEKSLKFALFYGLKMFNELNDIRRYVSRELRGERNLIISSQDLRSYCLSLEKVHKFINKKSSFDEIQKRIIKRFEKSGQEEIDFKMIAKESEITSKYNKTVQLLQGCLAFINHFATIVYLIECSYIYNKQKADKELEQCIDELIGELLK